MDAPRKTKTRKRSAAGQPDFARIRKVAGAVELERVQLVYAQVSGSPPWKRADPTSGPLLPGMETKSTHSADAHGIRVIQELRITVSADAGSKDTEKTKAESFVVIEVHLALVYRFSRKSNRPRLSKADIDEFVKVNGRYNAWPYLRAYVQRFTVDLGLPPLTLPLLRV